MKKGLLLVNLGTTAAPEPHATGQYLREFLMDPLVVDIPFLWRWILVNLLIVPRRRYTSSRAYKQIWLPSGSPLMVFSQSLLGALSRQMESHCSVALGMRYGEPSIDGALDLLKREGVEELFVLPLYPQFADSSTTTALLKVDESLRAVHWLPKRVKCLAHFFWFSGYINSTADLIAEKIQSFGPDHLLYSYHGLPERHLIHRKDLGSICQFDKACCSSWTDRNQFCYRAQCFATSRSLSSALDNKGLSILSSTAFQSRLGRTQWIRPNIEDELARLVHTGVKRLLVTCPSFVTDCLETLEEVGVRMRALFIDLGGEDLQLVSSLNASASWVASIVSLLENPMWLNLNELLEKLEASGQGNWQLTREKMS